MTRTPLAAALLALTLAACGGGDGDTDASPSPSATSPAATSAAPTALSKAEYVAAANTVCKRVLDAANDVAEPTDAAGYATVTEQLLTIVDDGQRDLRALVPPAEDAAAVEAFLAVNERQADVLRDALPKIKAAADAGDGDTAQAEFTAAVTTFNEIGDEQKEWAVGYGLTECYSD